MFSVEGLFEMGLWGRGEPSCEELQQGEDETESGDIWLGTERPGPGEDNSNSPI